MNTLPRGGASTHGTPCAAGTVFMLEFKELPC